MAVGRDYGLMMGNDDNGGVGAVDRQALHKGGRGGRIKGTVEFIQQQNRTGTKQGAGYGYALSLSFAEPSACFIAGCVQPHGEVKNKVGGSRMERFGQLGVSGLRRGQQKIIADGAVKK